MLLGAHESIAGGASLAFGRAESDGAECLQVFTRSARAWTASSLALDEVRRFRALARRSGLPCVAHGSYLVNLGADPGVVRNKSIAGFAEELRRCHDLGIRYLITHPGANKNEAHGIGLVARGLDEALRRAGPVVTRVLIEVTAGQGASIGHRFEHIAEIMGASAHRRVLGVCVDTCHLHASGYDITTPQGYGRTFEAFERTVGLSRIRAFHLNDCKKPLGARVDRHEDIGRGTMGLTAFRLLVNDPRFCDCPAILETPAPETYKKTIRLLKSLRD